MSRGAAPLRGIDVSEHNGAVDFAALRGKIDFAVLRCGYGGDYSFQDDEKFLQNALECERLDIPYGAYLYAYARNIDMAKNEAVHTLRLLRGRNIRFGVWYDVEDPAILACGGGLPNLCRAYCAALREAGFPWVGMYASLSVMERYFSGPELAPYEKWVAQWNSRCDYPDPGMWQYSDRGVIAGRAFDMNYAYKNYAEMTEDGMTQEKFNEMMEVYLSQVRQKPVSVWAGEAWEKAVKAGALDGTHPQSALTREETAIMLDRLKLL